MNLLTTFDQGSSILSLGVMGKKDMRKHVLSNLDPGENGPKVHRPAKEGRCYFWNGNDGSCKRGNSCFCETIPAIPRVCPLSPSPRLPIPPRAPRRHLSFATTL